MSSNNHSLPYLRLLFSTAFYSLLCVFMLGAAHLHAQNLYRFPALSPEGDRVAFSFQGDIWTADVSGGEARRLTIHESYESHPQWSPDGSRLLFQGERFGNEDVFVMNAQGGIPERLTYFSGSDAYPSWLGNDQFVFQTSRMWRELEWLSEAYVGNTSGGTPFRMMDALCSHPVPSPDGRYIAFERGVCRVTREAYQGSAAREIWVYDRETDSYHQITDFEGQDHHADWDDQGHLYFLSARSGVYNLFRVRIAEGQPAGEPEQLTNLKESGIRYYDVSLNGSTAVMEYADKLQILSLNKPAAPRELAVTAAEDYRHAPVEKVNVSSGLSEYALSPDNAHIALEVNGELFVRLEDKDRDRATRLTNHPWRDQSPAWINDSTLLFVSDRSGNRELYLLSSTDSDESDLWKSLRRGVTRLTDTEVDEGRPVLSPDRQKVAFMRGRGQLVVAEISGDGLSNEQILLDGWDTPGGLAWSPDSKWLAYSLDDLYFNQEIYIHAADGSMEPVNVSLHPRRDYSPVWSADGSKLGFLSERNNSDADVWFVWLKREDWEKTNRDWEEDEGEEEVKNGKKSEQDSAGSGSPAIEIDFDDIHERLRQVTSLPGNESDLAISKDGETFYFSTNRGGRSGAAGEPDFRKIKWDGTESKVLLEGKSIGNLQWDKKHSSIYYTSRGRLAKMSASDGKSMSLPFSARMEVDRFEQRRQIFDDAWRALRDGFYDPEFHGRDWDALRQTYEPWALKASTIQDFRDLYNEMLGQLNASHMGLRGGGTPEDPPSDRSGMLGVEWMPESDGLRISRVVEGTPADREASKLNIGELITAINGEPVGQGVNAWQLLDETAGERVLLEVMTSDGSVREVVIRPTSSIRDELYQSWVTERKRMVDELSGGRLGYIHIQGMNWPSFERFERELMASGNNKDGLVIDVRYNGGGWTTDMLMTILNVRQHAYTVPRGAAKDLTSENGKFSEYYPYGERLPFPAWVKPSIALCNESSYSNAEIFSHAFKSLGHGPLVGVPTFGAVISTGGYSLLDGSYVRMPFRGWYVKSTGQNMDFHPAVPDLIVSQPPGSKGRGEDPQLKKAVEELLKALD